MRQCFEQMSTTYCEKELRALPFPWRLSNGTGKILFTKIPRELEKMGWGLLLRREAPHGGVGLSFLLGCVWGNLLHKLSAPHSVLAKPLVALLGLGHIKCTWISVERHTGAERQIQISAGRQNLEVRSGAGLRRRSGTGSRPRYWGLGQAEARYLRDKGHICYLCYSWEIQYLTQKKHSINIDWLTGLNTFQSPVSSHRSQPMLSSEGWTLSAGSHWGRLPATGVNVCFRKDKGQAGCEAELWWPISTDDPCTYSSQSQQTHSWKG